MGRGNGTCDVLVGLQYGDEGKAKVIDALAPTYDIVARFNGGVNAGHTIVTDKGKLALRQIPSAVEYKNSTLYIGSGCVVSPSSLVEEIANINRVGISIEGRFFISPHASMVMPHHVLLDRMHGDHLGTTGNGIGPAYADRAFRMKLGVLTNIRMHMAVDSKAEVLSLAKAHLAELGKLTDAHSQLADELLVGLERSLDVIAPFVASSADFLSSRVQKGATVLFEGAQSFMLDVVNGDVPYVTSSLTRAAAAYSGGDVPPCYHRRAFGVAKAIMSRVGLGPFPSELGGKESDTYCAKDAGKAHTRDFEQKNFDPKQLIAEDSPFKVGQALRMLTGEYGTGSGRPRRVGMLDIPQLKGAVDANGIDQLFITKCDCLREFANTKNKTIPVVVAYSNDGQPVIKEYSAFDQDLSQVKSFDALPASLKEIIADVEKVTGTQVMGIGNGPHRDNLILRGSAGEASVEMR